jgi:hypothetical protein
MTRWRQPIGEEKMVASLQESLPLATRSGTAKPPDFTRVIVDTTVLTLPTDTKLTRRARERMVKLARKRGVKLRQSHVRFGKFALIRHQRYAHARQFKRANGAVKALRICLRRVPTNRTRTTACCLVLNLCPTRNQPTSGPKTHNAMPSLQNWTDLSVPNYSSPTARASIFRHPAAVIGSCSDPAAAGCVDSSNSISALSVSKAGLVTLGARSRSLAGVNRRGIGLPSYTSSPTR